MIILAIDTAAGFCQAGLYRDGQALAERRQAMARGHAEALAPMVAAALADAGIAPGAIGRLAVTVGPGGFTGLRLGLAFGIGFAAMTGVPIAAVTTTGALIAAASPVAGQVPVAALCSGRGDLFAQIGPGTDPFVTGVDLLAQRLAGRPPLVVGPGRAAVIAGVVGARDGGGDGPGLAAIAGLAAVAPRLHTADRPPGLVYLRAPDAIPARA